jgi:hypothetical protein
MAYSYALVPKKVADGFSLSDYRKKTADGRVLLYKDDLTVRGPAGMSLEDKVKNMGGELLTAADARKLKFV